MIRAGFALDQQKAVCLHKTSADGTLGGGIMVTGIGTQPMPGSICDDGVQKAVGFAAYYLQKTIDLLFEKVCIDTEYAANLILHQLGKLKENLGYISRHIGQGVYLFGMVFYSSGEQFVYLPFGETYAYLWDNEHILPLHKEQEGEHRYIHNALGGIAQFNTEVTKGELPVGHQILCMTHQPPENLLDGIMAELIHTNQAVVPVSVYKGLTQDDFPRAVLNIAQAVNHSRGGTAQ